MTGFRSLLRSVLAFVLALVFATGLAAAQSLRIGIEASASPALVVALDGVPRAGGEIGLEAHLATDPGGRLDLRWSDPLAGVGNLVLEASAEGRFGEAAVARGSLGARGVLGPIAARLEVGRFGAPPERFDAAAHLGDAPFGRGASARLALDGRVNRTWLVTVGTTAWWSSSDALGGTVVDVDLAARARALLGRELDGRIALEARWSAESDGYGVGIGVVHAPRRAPEVSGIAWLDVDARRGGTVTRPGFELQGAWRVGPDRIEASAVARPASRRRAPWSLDLTWRRPWGDGEVAFSAVGRRGELVGETLALTVRYRLPIDLADDASAVDYSSTGIRSPVVRSNR